VPSAAALTGLRDPQADQSRPDAVTAVSLALRIPVFTVVTLGLGLGAHVMAGGSPPTGGALATLAVLVGLAWRVVAAREQSLVRLTLTLWAMQAGLHVAMAEGGCGVAGGAVTGMSHPEAGHLLASSQVLLSCSGMPPGMAHGATGAPWAGMWVTHAVAGLLVALWLRRGEARVWRAVRRLLPRLREAFRAARVSLARRGPAWVSVPVADLHAPVLVALGDPRRGPPPSNR
jgi:hypothetical protein